MRATAESPSQEGSPRPADLHAGSGLTHGQVQIWTGQALHPGNPLYNMAFAIVLEGELDPEAFREAWQAVVDESDVLRSCIEETGGSPRRTIHSPGSCGLQLLDLTDRADPVQAFRDWAHARCAEALPMDGDLVHCALARLGPGRWGWYLNQHHLVTDAFSTTLLYRRVATGYARICGEDSAKPAPLASYYEVTDSLQGGFNEKARLDAIHHWQERLEQRTASFYGKSSNPGTTASRRHTVKLGAGRSERLRELAGESGFVSFTPDISLFAVFAALLSGWIHRLSGQDAVGFDAPAQNRPTPAAKESLGLFIEMFPFAVSIDEGLTFRQLGERCLAETQLFLRSALPGTSSPSGATASNVVLNFFTGSFGDFAGLPVTSEWVHAGHGDSVHAIRLQVCDYDQTGAFTLHFDFNEEVFPPADQQRSIQHFMAILEAALDDPDVPLATIDLLTKGEREAVLDALNKPSGQPLPARSVVELFDQQAAAHPDRIALRQDDRALTFCQLQAQANALAATLVSKGVGPGAPVAIYMRRSIEVVIAILATLKSRAAYIPIDPANPSKRTQYILADSGAAIVLVRDGSEANQPDTSTPILNVAASNIAEQSPTQCPESPQLSDRAYMIYTSGSTGLPKGVPIEHGGLADYLEWAARQYVRGEQLHFPLFTSLSFDLTVTSLYLPLITGGTLLIYPEPQGPVDSAVMDVVRDNRVEFIKLTPSHLSLLRQMDLSTSRLQRMVVGGEDFKTHLAAAISSQFGDRLEIYNEYGPTEAVVGCMIHRYDPETDRDASVPIGRPADHVQLYVLNDRLVPVPEGTPGELCIARHGLARGYHQREELTANHFVPHPFVEGERLYRTGDLVRFVRPGCLDYLGRIDRQMKVSGHRVEPGEIEAAVLSHPKVRDCVITMATSAGRRDGDADDLRFCVRCGLASNYPEAEFDDEGVCNVCRSYESVKERTGDYFGDRHELREIFAKAAARKTGEHDCMVLLSGGKDSTYTLCQVVDMGLKVYAFSLDNGYLSEQAMDNIRRVVKALGVDHEFATTPAMNAIFRDSLVRFSNVCNGCFKAIYTLSMNRARELGIPAIVTGLSRGQFFETRLTENMFRDGRCNPADIDRAVLAARKAYHRLEDEATRSLDVSHFQDDEIFEEIEFIDFFRYWDASLSDMLSYLESKVPWKRPSDTGRSTNCLVNDVGIYIHQKERGFHNYALPYSWDVRMGHKTREQAIEELDDELDMDNVRKMLGEIGYDENRLEGSDTPDGVAAYYVADADIPVDDLRRHLSASLPAPLIPQFFKRLDHIPLTASGKADLAALPAATTGEGSVEEHIPPEGPAQERIAGIWSEVLHTEHLSARKSFFELGGTSLAAMEVMLQICRQFETDLPLQTVFQHPTIEELAAAVEEQILAEIEQLSDEEAARLATAPPPES